MRPNVINRACKLALTNGNIRRFSVHDRRMHIQTTRCILCVNDDIELTACFAFRRNILAASTRRRDGWKKQYVEFFHSTGNVPGVTANETFAKVASISPFGSFAFRHARGISP